MLSKRRYSGLLNCSVPCTACTALTQIDSINPPNTDLVIRPFDACNRRKAIFYNKNITTSINSMQFTPTHMPLCRIVQQCTALRHSCERNRGGGYFRAVSLMYVHLCGKETKARYSDTHEYV